MAESNEIVMDIDGDGALDNIIMDQPKMEPNEQGEKVNLLELPKEMLAQILMHLEDRSLLTASHVCKSFASAAGMAFAQKYANEQYYILRREYVKKPLHKVMLTKYGDKIREIHMNYQDSELLTLIQQNCRRLSTVRLFNLSEMPMLKGLKKMAVPAYNFNRQTLTELIDNNAELEVFHIGCVENDLLNILDGRLEMLKNLALYWVYSATDLPKIRLKSLESLKMIHMSSNSCAHLLRTMNCNAIKVLKIKHCYGSHDDVIDEICSFGTLVSLQFHEHKSPLTADHLRKLSLHLPHLTDLGMTIAAGTSNLKNDIISVLSILPKLTKLTIRSYGGDDFAQLLNHLENSTYDFHGSFTKVNTEIEVMHGKCTVSIPKDRIIIFDNVTLAMKFVSTCAGKTFDITTFMHSEFQRTHSLDIKSAGPITVNENATRHPGFFPCLQKLKIHLDNHSAVGFLQKCDKYFCERIEELWLNTKDILGNQEVEQGADLLSILAKFENVKSLHLNPSVATTINVNHLFSVCHKLTDLRIRREW